MLLDHLSRSYDPSNVSWKKCLYMHGWHHDGYGFVEAHSQFFVKDTMLSYRSEFVRRASCRSMSARKNVDERCFRTRRAKVPRHQHRETDHANMRQYRRLLSANPAAMKRHQNTRFLSWYATAFIVLGLPMPPAPQSNTLEPAPYAIPVDFYPLFLPYLLSLCDSQESQG